MFYILSNFIKIDSTNLVYETINEIAFNTVLNPVVDILVPTCLLLSLTLRT